MSKPRRGDSFFKDGAFAALFKTRFKNANEMFGNWPITVWEVKDNSELDKAVKSKRAGVGDVGGTREKAFTTVSAKSVYKGGRGRSTDGATASIFPPRVALNILAMYGEGVTKIYDPFAGGGTRAIVAAEVGIPYLGVELRKDEVFVLRKLLEGREISDDMVEIFEGDSAYGVQTIADGECDFLYTCPPYWNLEKYKGGPADLSMMSYLDFLKTMRKVVKECHRILKPGSLACWVMGMTREGGKHNDLVLLHHDITRIHLEEGFKVKEEIVIYRNNPIALRRVGNFQRGNKLLIRMHEYCFVYRRL